MTKQEKLEPEEFRLIVKNHTIKRIITIPETKRGIKGKSVGGKQTYQMAIDAFTTRFQNKEELLDYAKANNLVSLPNMSYNDLYLEIEYVGKGEFNGNHSILYSNQKSLINFINNSVVQEYFPHDNPYVEEFKQTIIRYWTTGLFQAEYRIFMTGYHNRYFGKDLIDTLSYIKKRKLMEKIAEQQSVIGPVSHYHNLRGYFMTVKDLDNILFEITKDKIWSPQERAEYEREMHMENQTSIKLDIVKVPETKTKPVKQPLPNQQVLISETLIDTQEEHKTK